MSKQDIHLYEFGPFHLDSTERLLWRDGRPVAIAPIVFDTLVVLVERHGRLVPKEEMLKILWPDSFVEEGNLTNNISILRKTLGEGKGGHRYIETVPKSGYRFVAAVEELPDEVLVKERTRSSIVIEEEISCLAQSTDLAEATTTEEVKWRAKKRSTLKIRAICIALLVPALGAAAWLYFALQAPESSLPPMRVVPLTSFPGIEADPDFSPDGNQIAFAWQGEKDDNPDIYVMVIGSGRPLRLTTDPAFDFGPAWSPDGRQIAFIRQSATELAIFTVPPLGGAERKLLSLGPRPDWGEWTPSLDWSPDGKYIACSERRSKQEPFNLFLLSTETGEKRTLTGPPAEYWGDFNPRFSPDGQTLAFIRFITAGPADIYLIPFTGGEPRRLIFDDVSLSSSGLDWTQDGRAIIFSSGRKDLPGLWKIPVSGGTPEHLSIGGDHASGPSISRRGHCLAYTQGGGNIDIYRIEVPTSTGQPNAPTRFITSTRHDFPPQFSPDGKRIAFASDRTGSNEIWLCDSEGQNLAQLTSFGGPYGAGTPRWSPDGRQIVFDVHREGTGDIYVMDVEGSFPRRITSEPSDDVTPSWSRDGKLIYFASDRTGAMQVWKVPAEGGEAVQVTKQGGVLPFESTDEKFVYYTKGFTVAGIWRAALDGSEETPVVDSLKAGYWGDWALVGDGIYFINPDAEKGAVIEFFSFATRQTKQVADLGKVNIFVHGFAVSPDRRWMLYTLRNYISDIMLVENFRGMCQ